MPDAATLANTFQSVFNDNSTVNQDVLRRKLFSADPVERQRASREWTKQQQAQNGLLMNGTTSLFSRRSQMVRNFNPVSRGGGAIDYQYGISELMLPGESRAIDIPNASLQAINADQAYNQGRMNVMDKYFGTAGSGQYVDRNVLRDYLANVSKGFAGTGSMDKLVEARKQSANLDSQRAEVLRQNAGAATETRNIGGAVTGGTVNALNRIDEEQKNIGPGVSGWEAFRDAGYKQRGAMNVLSEIEKRKATTSNLPIVERVIK